MSNNLLGPLPEFRSHTVVNNCWVKTSLGFWINFRNLSGWGDENMYGEARTSIYFLHTIVRIDLAHKIYWGHLKDIFNVSHVRGNWLWTDDWQLDTELLDYRNIIISCNNWIYMIHIWNLYVGTKFRLLCMYSMYILLFLLVSNWRPLLLFLRRQVSAKYGHFQVWWLCRLCVHTMHVVVRCCHQTWKWPGLGWNRSSEKQEQWSPV